MIDAAKMVPDPQEAQKVQKAYATQVDKFLQPDKMPANVVGMGYGAKWSDGQPTGKAALLVLVSQTVAKEERAAGAVVPTKDGESTHDVLAVAALLLGQAQPSATP